MTKRKVLPTKGHEKPRKEEKGVAHGMTRKEEEDVARELRE